MLVFILLFLAALLVYCYGINRVLGLPPGPTPLPLIGNMLSFQWEMDKVFLAWKAQYGSIFTVWLPFPTVVIGDHKLLQEHIVRNGDVFSERKIPEQLMDILAGGNYGLAFMDNSMAREQRRFALRSLHDVGFGSAALEDTVYHYTEEIVARWRVTGDEPVDVTENIMRAVGNIIWNITFGITLEFDIPELIKFRQIQQDTIPLLANPFMMFVEQFPFLRKIDFLIGSPTKKLAKLNEDIVEYFREAIKTCEANFSPDNRPSCFVEAFLVEAKRLKDAGEPIGNFHYTQMLNCASTLWAAGFDTTVSVLRMAIIELVNHPEVQRKMQKEIDDVIGERRIRNEDAKLLPYTSAVLQEVYRLSNPLPLNFLRRTTQSTEIDGHSIAAGTTILPQFSMVHNNPDEFGRPDYFCPERHLNEHGLFVKDSRINPFSIGKRSCIGEQLARMEVFVMTATFVQSCNFIPVSKVPPALEFTTGLSRTVEDFLVKIQPRN